MPQLLWDASALSKRYFVEVGGDTVDALFAVDGTISRVTTFLCYAETCASLRRRLNQGTFDFSAFTMARTLLRNEVLLNPRFQLLTIQDTHITTGIALIDQHNINASDAAILATYLDHAQAQPPGSPTCVLVVAGQRLLRAAQLEGLHTLNPELVAAADIPALLASF